MSGLLMLEIFDLLQPGLRFLFCFVRAAEIFSFLGENFVTARNFLDHRRSSEPAKRVAEHSREEHRGATACGESGYSTMHIPEKPHADFVRENSVGDVLVRRRFEGDLLRALRKIVGRRDGENIFVAAHQQQPFEQASTLIVQKIFVPAIFHQFWNQHYELAVRMLFGQRQDVLNNRNDNKAVRRREDLELGWLATDLAKRADDVALPI